jgi:hypothetical protein
MEAIQRVALITGKPAERCTAMLFVVRKPGGTKDDGQSESW